MVTDVTTIACPMENLLKKKHTGVATRPTERVDRCFLIAYDISTLSDKFSLQTYSRPCVGEDDV